MKQGSFLRKKCPFYREILPSGRNVFPSLGSAKNARCGRIADEFSGKPKTHTGVADRGSGGLLSQNHSPIIRQRKTETIDRTGTFSMAICVLLRNLRYDRSLLSHFWDMDRITENQRFPRRLLQTYFKLSKHAFIL